MIIAPTAFIGRAPGFRGVINHLALDAQFDTAGGVVKRLRADRASADGLRWYPYNPGGDYARAVSSARPEGCFVPSHIVPFKGRLYVFGMLWRSTMAFESAVYVSSDRGVTLKKVTTPYETVGNIAYRAFVGVSANGDYLCALKEGGQILWTDGVNWSGRDDLPLGGPGPGQIIANAIVATDAGIAIGGCKPGTLTQRIIKASSPTGSFSVVAEPFGTYSILTAAAGDVALFFANYNSGGGTANLVSSPLDDLATWTSVSYPANRNVDKASYGAGRWLVGTINTWMTAPAGTGAWADATNKPWGATESRPRSTYHDGQAWYCHFGNGGLSLSSDGENWSIQQRTGLSNSGWYVAVYLGTPARLDFSQTSNSQYIGVF